MPIIRIYIYLFMFKIPNSCRAQLLNCYFSCSNGLCRSCHIVANGQVFTILSTALSHIAHNEIAAWGRRGVRYSSCGVQTFIFALHVLRATAPLAPNRTLCVRSFCERVVVVYFVFKLLSVFGLYYLLGATNFLLCFRTVITFRDGSQFAIHFRAVLLSRRD